MRTHATLVTPVAALLLASIGAPSARAQETFLKHPNPQVLIGRRIAPETLAESVALSMHTGWSGPRMHARVHRWMSKLPRSVVFPGRPEADGLGVLAGRPREGNPVDVATLLGFLASDIPAGGQVVGVGWGMYASSLLVGLAADAGARATVIDIDPAVVKQTRTTIARLVAAGRLPAEARWEVEAISAGDFVRSTPDQRVDRVGFGFAVPSQQRSLLQSFRGLLRGGGLLVAPLQERSDEVTQQLYLLEAGGNQLATGARVSFERGVFD